MMQRSNKNSIHEFLDGIYGFKFHWNDGWFAFCFKPWNLSLLRGFRQKLWVQHIFLLKLDIAEVFLTSALVMLSSHPGWTPRACLICGAIPMARGNKWGGDDKMSDRGGVPWTIGEKTESGFISHGIRSDIADIYTSFLKTKHVNWNPAKKCGQFFFGALPVPIVRWPVDVSPCHWGQRDGKWMTRMFCWLCPQEPGNTLELRETAGNSVQINFNSKKNMSHKKTLVETHSKYIPVNQHCNGKRTICRCISYWKSWISGLPWLQSSLFRLGLCPNIQAP